MPRLTQRHFFIIFIGYDGFVFAIFELHYFFLTTSQNYI